MKLPHMMERFLRRFKEMRGAVEPKASLDNMAGKTNRRTKGWNGDGITFESLDNTDEKPYQRGDLIGEHRVLDVFGGEGRSGMGIVYLVDGPEGVMILKTFQDRPTGQFAEQFKREAEVWVKIGWHPNVVRAFWVSELDFRLFVAAEFVPRDGDDRNSLADFISDRGCSTEQAIAWTYQFCYGMDHAISKGLRVHRDIKPANLMLHPDGTLKITDFGLAKPLRPRVASSGSKRGRDTSPTEGYVVDRTTEHGTIAGTPLYMAPEQFLSVSVDWRADIYSYGIVLYQLLSGGTYPYDISKLPPNDISSFRDMHLHATMKPIDTPLFSIVRRCMAKRLDERYQSYEELEEDLNNIAQGFRVVVTRPALGSAERNAELIAKARSLSALGKTDEALIAMNNYIGICPDESSAWTELGRIYSDLGDFSKSVLASLKSIELFSHSSAAWNNLGVAYHKRGDLDDADQALKSAVKLDPSNSGAMMNRALVLMDKEDYREPADLMLRALTLRPTKKTLLFNARNTAARLGQGLAPFEALALLQRLTEIEPENAMNWQNMAIVYIMLRRFKNEEGCREAIRCLKKVVELEPKNTFAIEQLARLSGDLGSFSDAIAYCDSLSTIPAEAEKACALKAQFVMHSGDYANAISLVENGIKEHSNSDSLWFVLSTLHGKHGNSSAELKALNRCKALLVSRGCARDTDPLYTVANRIAELTGKLQ